MRNREVQIKFYATEKERESIRRNAKRAGMKMGEYARAVLTSDDVSIKVIDTEPLKKAAHELAKQGTNLNQFMKFLMIQRIIFGQDAVAYDVVLVRDAAGI